MAVSPRPDSGPGGDRAAVLARYRATRATTEALAAPLSAEDQQVQSMPDASPAKWHRAHTSWFFETFLLSPHQTSYRAFDPRYGFLFNSYYEAVGPRQKARIARAATVYLSARPGLANEGVRFEVGTLGPGRLPRHLRDVWRPDDFPCDLMR